MTQTPFGWRHRGPLWSSGGERGLYKSTDGGKNWVNKLTINKWTGVTDLVIDPTNPDILYLASWQRHRNVAASHGWRPWNITVQEY